MTKGELLEENEGLISLLADIQDTVDLPESLQGRIDEFLDDEEDD